MVGHFEVEIFQGISLPETIHFAWNEMLPDIRHIKVNYGRWSAILSRSSKPQKEHLHPLRDVCVQHERNHLMGFWDIHRKWNLDRRPDIRGDTSTPAPTWWDKKNRLVKLVIFWIPHSLYSVSRCIFLDAFYFSRVATCICLPISERMFINIHQVTLTIQS